MKERRSEARSGQTMQRKLTRFLIVMVLLVFIDASVAGCTNKEGGIPVRQPATYYVAQAGGSDNNSCAQSVNEATPKLTVNAGIRCLAAGDTLIVKAGTYAEFFDNPFSNTGTSWTNVITIKAASPRQVIIRPNSGDNVMSFQSSSQKYVEFDGIEIDAINVVATGVNIGGDANHIRLKNCAIFNAGDQGVLILKSGGASPDFNEFINVEIAFTATSPSGLSRACFGSGSLPPAPPEDGYCHGFYIGSDNNVLDGVHLHHNNGNGVQFFPAGNRGNTIRNSLSHNNKAHGIISIGDDNRVINNVVYTNGGGGISIREKSNRIYHNTIYNNPNESNGLNLGGDGHEVKNNILYLNNYLNKAVGTLDGPNLVGIDPQFENPANGDFRLKTGSAAIDFGVALPEVTTDIDGTSRPQGIAYDIGAYEFSQ